MLKTQCVREKSKGGISIAENEKLVDLIAQLPVARVGPTQPEYGIFRNKYMKLMVEIRRRLGLPLDEAEWHKKSAASLQQERPILTGKNDRISVPPAEQDTSVAPRVIRAVRKKLEE